MNIMNNKNVWKQSLSFHQVHIQVSHPDPEGYPTSTREVTQVISNIADGSWVWGWVSNIEETYKSYKYYKTYNLITQTQEAYNFTTFPNFDESRCDTVDGSEIASIPTMIYRVLNRIPGSLGFYFTINGFTHFTPKEHKIPKNSPAFTRPDFIALRHGLVFVTKWEGNR